MGQAGRWERPALAAAVVAGFALRLWQLDGQSVWYDEAMSALYASRGWGEIVGLAAADVHPPLSFLLLKLWTALAGDGDWTLRWLSVGMGVVSIALAGQLAKRLAPQAAGNGAGVIAGWWLALLPMAVYYSQEARMYSEVVVLAALVAWLGVRAMAAARPWGWWGGFALAALAGVYTHYFFLLYMVGLGAGLGLAMLVQPPVTGRLRGLGGLAAATALTVVGFGPWAPVAWGRLQDDVSFFAAPVSGLDIGLAMAERFGFGWYQASPLQPSVALALGLAAAIAGVVVCATDGRSGWARAALCVAALLVPIGLYTLLAAGRPKLADRYLLALLPLFVTLGSVGIAAVAGWGWRRRASLAGAGVTFGMAAAGAVALGLALAGLENAWYGAATLRPDVRGVARTIAANAGPNDVVLAVGGHNQVALGRYLPSMVVIGIPDQTVFDLRRQVGEAVIDVLQLQAERHSSAWLVLWQRELADPAGLVLEALGSSRQRLDVPGRFAGVDVLRYDLRGPDFIRESVAALPVARRLTDGIELVAVQPGAAPWRAGSTRRVDLFWRADGVPSHDWFGTVQLLDAAGRVRAQADQRAGGDWFQARRWRPGEIVTDRYALALPPDLPPGRYQLIAALYGDDGQRLPASDGAEAVELAVIEVTP